MKILLGESNAKEGREDIFKQLGVKFYTKLVMRRESEQQTLPYRKI
jgi:hypothetical protein